MQQQSFYVGVTLAVRAIRCGAFPALTPEAMWQARDVLRASPRGLPGRGPRDPGGAVMAETSIRLRDGGTYDAGTLRS
jgi:hypothetical protein